MRAITSTTIGYFYTFGQFILPGLAYAIPQWRWLQFTVSMPFFAFFLLSWYVALSPSLPALGPPEPNRGTPCLTRLANPACPGTPLSQSQEELSREEELPTQRHAAGGIRCLGALRGRLR